jgi:hypothetical protein
MQISETGDLDWKRWSKIGQLERIAWICKLSMQGFFFILHKIKYFWSTEIFQLHLQKGIQPDVIGNWPVKLNTYKIVYKNIHLKEDYLEAYANTLQCDYIKEKWSSRTDRIYMQETVEVRHIKWKIALFLVMQW